MERSKTYAQVRAMAWQNLEVLDALIKRVKSPEARKRLEEQYQRLYERLKQDSL